MVDLGTYDPLTDWRCAKKTELKCPEGGCSKAEGCRIQNTVDEHLDIAIQENKYQMLKQSDMQVAMDLCEYSSDFEKYDYTMLIPHVADYRARRNGKQ